MRYFFTGPKALEPLFPGYITLPLVAFQVFSLEFGRGKGVIPAGQPLSVSESFHRLVWGTFNAEGAFPVRSASSCIELEPAALLKLVGSTNHHSIMGYLTVNG